MNTFDKNLKLLRNQRNLKQEELAERLHVTRQTVSGWETGRRQPDLDTLKKLAEVLEVDVRALIYDDKPVEYPRFQRKYVLCAAASVTVAAILVLFRLLLLPYLTAAANRNHWGSLLTVCYYLLPQIGSLAFGSFFPSLIRLFTPIPTAEGNRIGCLAAGMTSLIPVILFWLGIPPCCKWILSGIGNALLLYILPAISGTCIILGAFDETGS